jgi:hypothetical protein
VLNIAHASSDGAAVTTGPGLVEAHAVDWSARGVAAIPPAALVLSVELLVMIVRRAAIARTARLATASPADTAGMTMVRGDQAASMVAPAGDLPALEATTGTSDHRAEATGDQPTTAAAKATSAGRTDGWGDLPAGPRAV